MNRLHWKLVSLATLCSLFLPASHAQQQEIYTDAQGRPVSKQIYDAGLLMNEGVQLLHANRSQEALQRLQNAVAMAPELPDAHYNYGLALSKVGKLQEAAQQFQMTVQMKPEMEDAWMNLGAAYQMTGQIDEAIATLRQFINRFPSSRNAGKLSGLVQGLEKERARSGGSRQPAASTEASPTGFSQAAASSAGGADDYFSDVVNAKVGKWSLSRMPLRVLIRSGVGVPGYQPDFEKILIKSFQDWGAASGGVVSFKSVQDPAQADIECSWTYDSNKFMNSAEAGEAIAHSSKNGIERATIQILTVPLPMSPGVPVTPNSIRWVCLHEIGHALGLFGHTRNPQDVMFYSTSVVDQWKEISQRDANTLTRMYAQNSRQPGQQIPEAP